MGFTKTRIWHGGAFKLDDLQAQAPDEPGPVDAPERDLGEGAGCAHSDLGETAAVGAESEATRFYPIEALFPGQARSTGQTEDPEPTGGSRASSRGLLERVRRGWLAKATTLSVPTRGERLLRRALILAPLVALALIAALTLARSRERVPFEEVGASSAPASHGTASGLGADASNPSPTEPLAPAEAEQPTELTPGLERAAVDALIRGDLDEAERRYRELVRQNPTQPAFREALRILTNRAPTR